MPSTANIVVADATPTNHTFAPQSASLALSTWQESSAETYEGNGRIAISMSPPNSSRKTSRMKLTCALPIERTVDDVVKVTDTILYTVEAVVPSTCSAGEAANAFALVKNTLANALIGGYFADRTPVF